MVFFGYDLSATLFTLAKCRLANVWPTSSGSTRLASAYIFTGVASLRILPHETASSGLAPLSLPSYSDAVFRKTEKLAPLR